MKLELKNPTVRYRYWATEGERKWSIIDIGDLMSTAAIALDKYYRETGAFLGWEAAEEINGELDFDNLIRAETWEELKKLLV